jgi:4-hydroxy-tetrahydrodipicolinate synthase
MNFEGIYTPIITPFNADLSINFDELGRLVEFLINSGVNGIVVGGTTGEYYAETHEERRAIMDFVNNELRGRVPLIAGVGAIRTEEAIDLALYAKSLKIEGLLVGSPPYAVPSEEENAAHALAISKAAHLPIMLYNYPGRTGANMGGKYLNMVSQDQNFCAIKESSGDINKLHDLVSMYPKMQISCGTDDQALEYFAWGAKSWVCGGSNFLPLEHKFLYETCVLNGEFNLGRKIMLALLPLLQFLEQGGKFVQSIKHGCNMNGFKSGSVRRPLLPLSFEAIGLWESTIADVKINISKLRASSSTLKRAERLSGYA